MPSRKTWRKAEQTAGSRTCSRLNPKPMSLTGSRRRNGKAHDLSDRNRRLPPDRRGKHRLGRRKGNSTLESMRQENRYRDMAVVSRHPTRNWSPLESIGNARTQHTSYTIVDRCHPSRGLYRTINCRAFGDSLIKRRMPCALRFRLSNLPSTTASAPSRRDSYSSYVYQWRSSTRASWRRLENDASRSNRDGGSISLRRLAMVPFQDSGLPTT